MALMSDIKTFDWINTQSEAKCLNMDETCKILFSRFIPTKQKKEEMEKKVKKNSTTFLSC